jgi:hypothetical protein
MTRPRLSVALVALAKVRQLVNQCFVQFIHCRNLEEMSAVEAMTLL